jgi:hypothetical protein
MKTTEQNKTLDTDSIAFEQKVQQLKNKYGAIYQIEIADQRIIFRPITRKEYKEVMNLKAEDGEESIVMKREDIIAKHSIVYPEATEVETLLEEYAGVAEVICDECMKISGFLNNNERIVNKL